MVNVEVFLPLMEKKTSAILNVLFNTPGDFYLRELAVKANVPPATTLRILRKLVPLELVQVNQVKHIKLYSIAKNEKTHTLSSLFKKEVKILEFFVNSVKSMPGLQAVYVHGEESEDRINVLLIGDNLDQGFLRNLISQIKDSYNYVITYLIVTLEQYRQMSQMGLWGRQRKVLWEKQN